MRKNIKINILVFILCSFLIPLSVSSQKEAYHFTLTKENPATPIRDQAWSGTCWSFGTISFIESELLRMGKERIDLSEMFIVRHIYPEKIENYLRWHGKVFLTAGGQSHDVMRIIREYGLMTEQAYDGRLSPRTPYDHRELDSLMKSTADHLLNLRKPGSRWKMATEILLDLYLGQDPATFDYKGQTFTPQSFRDYSGINPDDYVEITSYQDHPWYLSYVMDSKYNWSHDLYYNVPLDEFMEIINYSLEHGFTLAWDGDVSEEGFSFDNGIAIIPQQSWEDKNHQEKINAFIYPEKEIKVKDENRQETFNSGATTIDHIMHIIGIAKDQKGNIFYYTKNSWGEFNGRGGYMYLSESYVRMKTVAVMVHKDGIPANIREKLNIK